MVSFLHQERVKSIFLGGLSLLVKSESRCAEDESGNGDTSGSSGGDAALGCLWLSVNFKGLRVSFTSFIFTSGGSFG